jgi:hypothetical protein
LALLSTSVRADTQVGMLECSVAGGVGLILGSSKETRCRFTSSDGKFLDFYKGRVNKLGIDIGITGKSVLLWQVIAPVTQIGPGDLAGTYRGLSGQATVGVGASANILVGGSKNTFSLQPLSVGAQAGFNIAAGIGSIHLEHAQ